ncbi:uncharacterized protein BX664DRAFT_339159 [Halteromyces radiatus]|uniref:uncharacterized protein n=1 Tax=Halteromyces radiatus TaxID=101107 RepID=UPI00221E6693|nr:uncharacterized protein BX664DRAFT_339159 [Halteromyces radiatus]KAI8082829.1 hypothetical protein BX664DRAFT_339159 [Halteromyces radiatus]
MDPSHCTVVILQQPQPQPFIINDGSDQQLSQPSYLSILQSVFAQVSITSHQTEAFSWIKQQPSTLLLLDLDDQEDDSLGCFANITWVANITQLVEDDNVPVIVCSSNENASFMLDCIHAGAADYILKPMRLDVVKTLFLALHRRRSHSKMHDDHGSSPTLSSDNVMSPAATTTTTTTTTAPITPTNFQSLQHHPLRDDSSLQLRLKEIVEKDSLLSKVVMDIYAPLPPVSVDMSLSSESAKLLQNKIDRWDFSPFELNHQELIHCVILMFKPVLACPELDHLIVTQEQLYDFISDLSSVYHDANPYHNFAHAVDVLQCSYYTLQQLGVLPFESRQDQSLPSFKPQHLLRPIDVLALFIAAIGHDAAHPGVNNLFLVNSAAPLALLYNDRSVLESFHSMTLFQLMKKHGLDQISGGSGTLNYQEFRKTVVTSILATDMSLHNDYVLKIQEQATRLLDRTPTSKIDEEQERLLLCSAIIKCADISNVARPFLQSTKWAELLVEEFACQGDLEKELGMPVSLLNDREKLILEESQIGFIRFVAMGLFQRVREVMQEMTFAVDQLESNLQRWENRKHTTHDSGVSTLADKENELLQRNDKVTDPSTTVILGSDDNDGDHTNRDTDNSSPYNVQPDVEFLHTRISIDTANELTSMPAMAMKHYSSAGKVDDRDDFSTLSHFPSTGNHPPGWHDGPVYCQCTIQ